MTLVEWALSSVTGDNNDSKGVKLEIDVESSSSFAQFLSTQDTQVFLSTSPESGFLVQNTQLLPKR